MAWSSALHFCHPSKAEGRAARPQGPLTLPPPLLLRFPLGLSEQPSSPIRNSACTTHLAASPICFPPPPVSGCPSFVPSGSKQGTSGRERAELGDRQAAHRGLEPQAGDSWGGGWSLPPPQHEMHKVLGWRDGSTYPQMGPRLKHGQSHRARAMSVYVTMATKQSLWRSGFGVCKKGMGLGPQG